MFRVFYYNNKMKKDGVYVKISIWGKFIVLNVRIRLKNLKISK